LLDSQSRYVDENDIALVLDHQGLGVVNECEIDRPAGKSNLLAGGAQYLVTRHNDTTVGLDSDRQSIELVVVAAVR
jgi:hypothetical protein